MRHIDEVIIHCAATRPEWMRLETIDKVIAEIRRWHVAGNGWSDIGYHYVIDRAGNIGLGRPVSRSGAHTRGHNANSIGVCLLGGHGATASEPFRENFTAAQDTALRDLIASLRMDFPRIAKISGHNEYANKACPGFKVSEWLRERPVVPDAPIKPDPAPRGLFGYIRSLFWLLKNR